MNVDFGIPLDKQAHFWWGMALAGVFYSVLGMGVIWVVLFVAVLKEVIDERQGRIFDWGDIIFTVVGSWVGAILRLVLA